MKLIANIGFHWEFYQEFKKNDCRFIFNFFSTDAWQSSDDLILIKFLNLWLKYRKIVLE